MNLDENKDGILKNAHRTPKKSTHDRSRAEFRPNKLQHHQQHSHTTLSIYTVKFDETMATTAMMRIHRREERKSNFMMSFQKRINMMIVMAMTNLLAVTVFFVVVVVVVVNTVDAVPIKLSGVNYSIRQGKTHRHTDI